MKSAVTGSIGFRIRENHIFATPWRELVKDIETFSSDNIADGVKGMYCMDAGIRRMFPCKKILGPALTIKLRPGDNLMLHKAVEMVGDGYIIVADTMGCMSHALMGELMAIALTKQGAGGMVIDGVMRDVDDVARMGFPVFARGSVSCAGDKEGPGEINFPVCCGGMVVNPGDFVIGDASGVVVIPRDDVAEVAAGTRKKLDYEAVRKREMDEGKIIKGNINDILRQKGAL